MAERVTPTMPMAAQVLAEIKRHSRGKVIRLKDVFAGRTMAKELQTSVASPPRLEHLVLRSRPRSSSRA